MNLNILEKLPFRIPELNEKNRHYFVIGIIVFVFLADYFLLARPQLNTLIKLSPKIANLNKDIKQGKSDIEKINEYQSKVEELNKKLAAVGDRVITKEEIPILLDEISRLANASKIQINQLSPVKEAQELLLENADGKYYSIPVELTGRGRYHDVGRFLNRLESDRIFMRVADFSIAGTNDDSMLQAAKATIQAFILEKPEGSQ